MNDRPARSWILLLSVLVMMIFSIRMTEPNDYEADAQDRNIGYVMDVLWNGHWLVQSDVRDRVMSKPPLHTWLVSLTALAAGGINRVTLTLPSALSILAAALLVLFVGRRRFGLIAGGCAALAIVLSPIMTRHIVLARTDALFTLTIALAAFAAYRAWERGGGWLPFWLWAAAATLTKGPLGLLLAAVGLAAWFWERRDNPATEPLRGLQKAGIVLYLGLTLGWLLLAIAAEGDALIDKMIYSELLGQATGVRKGLTPGENFYKPVFFFTLRMLPFSVFAWIGLWRVVARPASDPSERRFERFLFCWFMVGIAIFSAAAHFRADLLLPLWPPAALLAGREMARLGDRFGPRIFSAGCGMVIAAMLATIFWNYTAKHRTWPKEVRYTLAAEAAARAIRDSGLDINRLQHLDTPVTLQLTLGTYRFWITEKEAIARVEGGEPVLLAVESPGNFPRLFGPDANLSVTLKPVLEVPGVKVFSNH